ncbi:NAD-glutamate dehydrogenase [Vibrio chagasii]|nr:NAD-glutamate dehydrogenase [Vibrio chagasii]
MDDDRIIRASLHEMITATLRTNYYQVDENKQSKPWLALKMRPKRDSVSSAGSCVWIFVYAPDIEVCIYVAVK